MILPLLLGLAVGLALGALLSYALMVRRTVRLQSELEAMRQFKERDAERLTQVERQFRDAFQSLAQEILDAKAESFTSHNARQLQAILEPLRQRIQEFQAKVEAPNRKHGEDSILGTLDSLCPGKRAPYKALKGE